MGMTSPSHRQIRVLPNRVLRENASHPPYIRTLAEVREIAARRNTLGLRSRRELSQNTVSWAAGNRPHASYRWCEDNSFEPVAWVRKKSKETKSPVLHLRTDHGNVSFAFGPESLRVADLVADPDSIGATT